MSAFSSTDLPAFFAHFLMLSMLSIGGAISVAPEMHRYLVAEQGWLGDADFVSAVALAQAAPGPNVLFVPVLGYMVDGLVGAGVALLGILLPSTALSLAVSRWGGRRRDTLLVRGFTAGLAPVTVGLVFAVSWVLASPFLRSPDHRVGAGALIAGTAMLIMRWKLMPIWLVLAGAVAGALGWI